MSLRSSLLIGAALQVAALQNGLSLTPPMGLNSWTSVGTGVSAQFLINAAQVMSSKGLRAAGYEFVNSDDGWSLGSRDASGRLVADPTKFPGGISNLTAILHGMGFKFGIYTAVSSVVCSGRPGSLRSEVLDAATFASWGVDYLKTDNCGEYGFGSSRFFAWADAVNATGVPMVISTEPFALWPTPAHGLFANLWRSGNDINAAYGTIVNRADLNNNWADYTGPGQWADPDMLQVGNGALTDAECRTHFGLWAIMKSPLILGSNLNHLTAPQLAIISNANVIAVNQDPLGIQAKKLAANGTVTPRFVGIAPCTSDPNLGVNGVSAGRMVWTVQPQGASGLFSIFHNATQRCLSAQPYLNRPTPVPVLLPCSSQDAFQTWNFSQASSMGGLINVALGMALTVGDSTLYGAVHGSDPIPNLDAAYGLMNLTFTPFAPEAPCNNRGCDDYVPQQSWYFSRSTSRISLALFAANGYRCFEGSCYVLTQHLPVYADMCLTQVAAISNDGVATNVGGVHVWGGALSGGAFVMAAENRDSSNTTAFVDFSLLESPSLGPSTSACVRELFSNTSFGAVSGGVTVTLPTHDIAVLRIVPGATAC